MAIKEANNKVVEKQSMRTKEILSRIACDLSLKVHKNENFFGFDFEFCTISLLVMSKY